MAISDLKYLELLSKEYPTIQSACTEIINLSAILNLPKGTEHFISDVHGEDEAFCHILNNASGVIREKVNMLFEKNVSTKTRTELCTLIYYPERKLDDIKQSEADLDEWYRITLYRLIDVCRLCASKYTRSKVRKTLPKDFEYIIDELLHTDYDDKDKHDYYENIVSTIISIHRSDAFIIALANVIKRLVVDRLHIVGDIFDRGPHADVILDRLLLHHSVDIQWGNHDILWMGAAAGSGACIASVLNISTKYSNIDFVENAYGINLRPLALFAQETYTDNTDLLDHMHKAIAIMQFKLEGQIIMRHPEYDMDDRLLLDKIDFEKGTVLVDHAVYPLNDTDFPTIDKNAPYDLTTEEKSVLSQLIYSFTQSEKLQRHIQFLYSQGSLYKVFNGNLLFHGCIPMRADGSFYEFDVYGKKMHGKGYMDFADSLARQGYYAQYGTPQRQSGQDFLWYLWCGKRSPLFGRDKISTFERMFIDDKHAWKEEKNPYYDLVEHQEMCIKVLHEFGLDDQYSHIINGHVPVLSKEGEVPVKGGGKLIVIDGGFCKAYQNKTGIAGYTMFYNSYGIRLVSHEPFCGLANAIRDNKDILSTFVVFDTAAARITVRHTDVGRELSCNIDELTALLEAFRSGALKEKRQVTTGSRT
ncbi:MAG: fructose-1,6-bisphosphatase [Christensenellaceae bacterium]